MQADGFHNPPFGGGKGGGGDSDSERSIKMNDRSSMVDSMSNDCTVGSQSLAAVELFTQIPVAATASARLNLYFVAELGAATTTSSG